MLACVILSIIGSKCIIFAKYITQIMSQKLPTLLLTFLVCLSIAIYFFYQTYTVNKSPVFNLHEGKESVEIKKDSPHVYFIYSYRDLDAQMCRKFVDLNKKTKSKLLAEECPKEGIVSIRTKGRTGNQLWEYASLWAVARHTRLQPYVPSCIKATLLNIFEHLSIPDFSKIADCPIQLNKFVMSIDKWTSHNQSILLPSSFLSTLVFPHLRDLRREMKFTKQLRTKVQVILHGFLKNRPSKTYTFIGVHVRRTDYIRYIKTRYHKNIVTRQFFINAMNYYKHKYRNCLFVYVSDDPTWCIEQFGKLENVVVATNNTPAEDLALMGACNHSIIDYGTYGEWGAIFGGGEVVTQDYHVGGRLPRMHRISQKAPN